tara:strand:- start:7427 stop:9019 length:1593 start_codon:yes stop_codon:yes gene_type:complete
MLNRFFKAPAAYMLIFGLSVSAVGMTSTYAYAQQCNAPYETITRLHHPDPGAFMVWNTIYGEEGRQEKFASAIAQDDGGVIAAGQVVMTAGVRPSLLLVAFDKRGRKAWEKIHGIPYLDGVVKILQDGGGSVILANQKPNEKDGNIWMGFFDGAGQLKSQKIIKNPSQNLHANDIQPRVGGDGWVVTMSSIHGVVKGEAELQKNATVLILDREGKQVGNRSYILGKKTQVSNLGVSKFSDDRYGYIATGYFENNEGKNIGWALRLNPDLSIVWQREFSRGISANVVSSVNDGHGGVLVAGNIKAADSKAGGVWLAKLEDADGSMRWQRYYMGETEEHTYSVRGVSVNKDGLIALLMMAKFDEKDSAQQQSDPSAQDKMSGFGITSQSDYAHLLTLSPRGITLSGDAFYYGQGVFLSQLLEDLSGRRVMVGYSFVEPDKTEQLQREALQPKNTPLQEDGVVNLPDVELSDKAKTGLALLQKKIDAQTVISQNEDVQGAEESANTAKGMGGLVQKGWVVVGDMPDPYVDPCE